MLGTLKLKQGKYNATKLQEDGLGVISLWEFSQNLSLIHHCPLRWQKVNESISCPHSPTAGKRNRKLPSHTGLLCRQCIVFSNKNLPLNIVLAINVLMTQKKILNFYPKSRHTTYLLSVGISFFLMLQLQGA